jgi:hypothetical protein
LEQVDKTPVGIASKLQSTFKSYKP